MKLIDGIFKYGETVAIDIDGKLVKRKVHYADGELYVDVDGKRIRADDLTERKTFDMYAYVSEYQKKHNERISLLVKKGTKRRWKIAADDLNMSMNAFVSYCVEKEIER